MATENFAIPLFALIDKSKVEPEKPLPDTLADQLQMYLQQSCGIHCLSCKFLSGGDSPMLVLHGVEEPSLAALFSLVDVQKTELFRYERTGEEEVTLTPLRIKVD